jgi:hypothetical protein
VVRRLQGRVHTRNRRYCYPLTITDFASRYLLTMLAGICAEVTTICPAIFGSMFQSVRYAETRRKLGEYYTSETNILKTLNPVPLQNSARGP